MDRIILKLQQKINYKWFFWGWLAIILIGSSIPNLNASKINLSSSKFEIRLDYILHLFIYLVLAVLFIKWKINIISKKPFILLPITWLAGISIGFIEEVHQLIIPGRAYNLIDFYFNSIGLTIGIFVTYFITIKNKTTQI